MNAQPPADMTALPDLLHGQGRSGPVRQRRPVYVNLLPPCNAGCPAGENIQAWLAHAQAGRHERAWRRASFVGCHQFGLLDRVDVLRQVAPGATLLLNCPCPAGEVWDALPRPVQEKILAKRVQLYAIDAGRSTPATGPVRHSPQPKGRPAGRHQPPAFSGGPA